MPIGMNLKVFVEPADFDDKDYVEQFDNMINDINQFMKGKNVLATSVKNHSVWIWWKEGNESSSDHEFNTD